MVVALPVTEDGQVGGGWGRARDVAIAQVEVHGRIERWETFHVGWDQAHDQDGEGQHHARIARFLLDHQVQRVVTGHMGPGMLHMLERMSIAVVQNASGPAQEAATQYGRLEGPA